MEDQEKLAVEDGEMKNWKFLGFAVLTTYILFLFYLAVLSRDTMRQSLMYFDLFRCYSQSGLSGHDTVVNIACFVPVGVMVGILSRRHRVVKALLAGLLMSLMIESSQLIWKRGVFDVDDLVNNAVGAVIGGIVWAAIKSLGNGRNKEMRIFSQREKH